MTGDLVPRGVMHDEVMYVKMMKHITDRWDSLRRTPGRAPRPTRRIMIDRWLDGCEIALKHTCPHFFDEDGRPLQ